MNFLFCLFCDFLSPTSVLVIVASHMIMEGYTEVMANVHFIL